MDSLPRKTAGKAECIGPNGDKLIDKMAGVYGRSVLVADFLKQVGSKVIN